MTEEAEFKDWAEQAITRDFMRWVEQTVHDSEAAWGRLLNGGGELDMQRARLSERARLATEIINVSYEDIYGEPERDSADRVQNSSSTR